MVLPAWRWYILPVVQELGGFNEEMEEEEPEKGEAYMPPVLPEDLYRELEALKRQVETLQEEKAALEKQLRR